MLAANSKPLSTSTSTTTTDTDLTNVNHTFESFFYTPSFFVPNPPTRHENKSMIESTVYPVSSSFFHSDSEEPSPKHDSHFDLTFARQYQLSLARPDINTQFNPTCYATSNYGQQDPPSTPHYQPYMSDMHQHQLKEANQLIQKLANQLSLMNIEMEKKTAHFQAALEAKEMKLKEQEQKLMMANHLYESQTMRLNELLKMNRFCLGEFSDHDTGVYKYSLDTMTTMHDHSETIDNIAHCNTKPIPNIKERRPLSSSCRIIDKNSVTNWDSLVDRITKETDQHASLLMQQKLKSATQEQKQLIFEAILEQAYALMTNRFGNFLVQRLFELGTPEQIEAMADKMRGHVVELTCEPFGCHVVQKALDCVKETSKAELVSELFVSILETITHKYACHVWQKVFELRWTQAPPPVMQRLHAVLQGHWTQVALDETGSLVIQNIFENLPEIDKRPVLNEVLDNLLVIAKGQWGNWVVQHILEQAEKKSDRERAFAVVIEEATQLSMDQFASKVVEKTLRIGGQQFITQFIKRISETSYANRPRMALVDIASDQYGNYVIQWLINHATEEQKAFICRSIKRHMVSLRGSKYGQRVAFLVEKVLRNYETTTYPIQ
ncbi:armadillo-type protein [Blakeslea trispora]|nr:armadillo-type protein [Blakeslea trispora]